MDFIEKHPWRNAFVGLRTGSLVELIEAQGEHLLKEQGIQIPTRAVSTMLLIDGLEKPTIADITRELGQVHQVVQQRVDLLIELGLVERVQDASDGRRKILKLTRAGRREVTLLNKTMAAAAAAFEEAFAEIGEDYLALTNALIVALRKRPLTERIEASRNASPKRVRAR